VRMLRIALVGSALLLAYPSSPISATCERHFEPFSEYAQSYPTIFLGQVISIVAKDESGVPSNDGRMNYGYYEVTLRAIRAWTPGVSRTMVVRTGAGSPYGYSFQMGRMYLVFAATRADSNVLEVDDCGPTRASQLASADVSQLDKRMASYVPK
jgi:hypothetical protein